MTHDSPAQLTLEACLVWRWYCGAFHGDGLIRAEAALRLQTHRNDILINISKYLFCRTQTQFN